MSVETKKDTGTCPFRFLSVYGRWNMISISLSARQKMSSLLNIVESPLSWHERRFLANTSDTKKEKSQVLTYFDRLAGF